VGGKIVAEGPPASLVAAGITTTTIHFHVTADGARPPGDGWEEKDGAYEKATDDPVRELHDLTGWALRHNVELRELTVTQPSLEDVYLQLTGAAAPAESAEPPARGRSRRRRR
jgi:ABC-2 type transport system ATP-binding protein